MLSVCIIRILILLEAYERKVIKIIRILDIHNILIILDYTIYFLKHEMFPT